MRRIVAVSLAVISLLTLAGCERWALDRQMEEFCKKDGGIKVYETVILPASFYDKYGVLKSGPLMPVAEDAWFVRIGSGDDYHHVVRNEYIAGKGANTERGEGYLKRVHEAVYRWQDKHLLGEMVLYSRGGGDWITFGFQPSTNFCPRPRVSLTQFVFIKGE